MPILILWHELDLQLSLSPPQPSSNEAAVGNEAVDNDVEMETQEAAMDVDNRPRGSPGFREPGGRKFPSPACWQSSVDRWCNSGTPSVAEPARRSIAAH
jgi:hypothetical protein